MTDKDEFCAQIRRWEKAMYALAFSVVKNDADAAEVLSESIYRAYRNLDSLKNRDAFKAWVLCIVHNTAVELVRKNQKVVSLDELPERKDDGYENRLTVSLTLRQAVEGLKQPYRTVVVLFYYENLSVSEIAQITGTNVAAVKQQLSRARKMLRTALKEDFSV